MEALTPVYLVAYAAAVALYLAYHAGLREAIGRAGRGALIVAFLVQGIDIGLRCAQLQHPATSTAEAMSFLAWLIAGAYLAASLRYRLHAAGAFAVPAALVLLVLARVVPARDAAPVVGTLGMVHIFLSMLGAALFALAAAVEVLYLVQERRLKRHQLNRAAGGGAPLDTLDRLAARCVSVGFPVFTLAIVTGAIWVARLGLLQRGALGRPEHLLAVASWIAFGALLLARVGAGWQGRRAAWLTVGGFTGVLLVLLGYFLRATA